MTAIFYDLNRKILVCDSQASDLDGNAVILDAIKFGISDHFVSVAAGSADACIQFNTLITEQRYKEAIDYLNSMSMDDLVPITVHKESGSYIPELSRGLSRNGCSISYQGSGGDFLRHNYAASDQQIEVAYDNLIKDKYTFSGGLMRMYDFTSGANNMEKVDYKVAANDEKKNYHFPVGQKTFDAKWTNDTKHQNIKAIKELLK